MAPIEIKDTRVCKGHVLTHFSEKVSKSVQKIKFFKSFAQNSKKLGGLPV